MFMSFSNFLLWKVCPSAAIHGQYIFITYDLAGRERKNFQQRIRIIEQKLISTTWPQ